MYNIGINIGLDRGRRILERRWLIQLKIRLNKFIDLRFIEKLKGRHVSEQVYTHLAFIKCGFRC